MDNSKDDSYFIERIKKNLLFIIKNTQNITKTSFEHNQLLIDSVMFRLIQISEDSDRLSIDFKNKYKEIPYKAIKGMRNIIVHDYGIVDLSIIYQTITVSIPQYLQIIKNINI